MESTRKAPEAPYFIQAYRRRGARLYWVTVFEGQQPVSCATEEEAWLYIKELLARGEGAVRAMQQGKAILSACLNTDGTGTRWGPNGMRHFELREAA